jgi:hypothetical protein
MYVKVSMDGAPYLRKVDIKMYSSYEDLSLALEKMFSCFIAGEWCSVLCLCSMLFPLVCCIHGHFSKLVDWIRCDVQWRFSCREDDHGARQNRNGLSVGLALFLSSFASGCVWVLVWRWLLWGKWGGRTARGGGGAVGGGGRLRGLLTAWHHAIADAMRGCAGVFCMFNTPDDQAQCDVSTRRQLACLLSFFRLSLSAY